jgi:hypothetical protein
VHLFARGAQADVEPGGVLPLAIHSDITSGVRATIKYNSGLCPAQEISVQIDRGKWHFFGPDFLLIN